MVFLSMGEMNRYYYPKSLCQYFWTFVGYSIRALLLLSVFIGVVLFLPVSLYSWLHNGSSTAKALFLIVTGVISFAAMIVLICKTVEIVQDKMAVSDVTRATSMTGIVFGMLRAAKNKVCPFIEYRD